MGKHNIDPKLDEHRMQAFTQALLADLHALEFMLEHDQLEKYSNRIGAEQ